MKNWKTTLFGVLAAIVIAIAPLIETGEVKWQNLLLAAIVAAFGYFTEDKKDTE